MRQKGEEVVRIAGGDYVRRPCIGCGEMILVAAAAAQKNALCESCYPPARGSTEQHDTGGGRRVSRKGETQS